MPVDVVSIVGIVCTLVGAPLIVFGAILGMKWIKFKHRELEVRMEEAAVLRDRLHLEAMKLEDTHLDQSARRSPQG